MRVAYLTHAYGEGGGVVGRHVQALAQAVARDGGSAEVLAFRGPLVTAARAESGIHVLTAPSIIHRRLARETEAVVDRTDLDLVHVHGRIPPGALYAVRRSAKRIVFTPHDYATAPRTLRQLAQGRDPRLEAELLNEADLVLCASRVEALQVERRAQATIQVIPTGFEAQEIISARPFAVAGRVILTVDRLTRWSGIHRIISALPALSPIHRVVVIGRGHGRGALETHADYLRVADRVQFLGGVDDDLLHRWLRTASVVVTLKEESLLGWLLMAAACAGSPVVASDIPANREAAATIGSTDVRFVSRRASPFLVADAIRDQALAGSRAHRDQVQSWEEMAESTLSAYRRIVSRPAVAQAR